MEATATQEIFREENRQIAATIEGLLERGEMLPSGVQIRGGHHIGNEDFVAAIGVAYDPESAKADMDYFINIPEGFNTPAFLFKSWEIGDYSERVTTPYGVQNAYVIGADNKIYYLGNTYFFNKDGKAVKHEEVYNMSDTWESSPEEIEETIEKVWGSKPPTNLTRVDFIPKVEDSRDVGLEKGDYEKVWGILKQIQRREFVDHDGRSIV